MKIYYFSPFDILRPRTNQISDTHLCEGFAENGCDVELIAPYVYRKDNVKKHRILEYYGVRTAYKIKILKTFFRETTPDSIKLSITCLYGFGVIIRLLLSNVLHLGDVVVMSRNANLLLMPVFLKKMLRLQNGPKVICWVHEVVPKKSHSWVYRNADGVVGTNSAIVEDLLEKLHLPSNNLAVSMNPIAESQIQHVMAKAAARKVLNLNCSKPLIVYTGKLFIKQKEAEYILEAARQCPNFKFLLTGGKPNVIEYYKNWCAERNIHNVIFTGFLNNYTEVRYYQFAADVLVSYYSAQEHDVRYNLPNKICEYMLTRNPIVTCSFPAVKDTLNAANAIFVEPENPASLVQGIRMAVENKEEATRIAEQAFQDVKEMTFKKRTKLLLDFFQTLNFNSENLRRISKRAENRSPVVTGQF